MADDSCVTIVNHFYNGSFDLGAAAVQLSVYPIQSRLVGYQVGAVDFDDYLLWRHDVVFGHGDVVGVAVEVMVIHLLSAFCGWVEETR